MRHLFLSLCLAFLVSAAMAAPVDTVAARQAAARFIAALEYPGTPSSRSVRSAVASLRLSRPAEAAYLFTSPGGHYVVAAADDRLPAILGYGTCRSDAPPAAMSAWLDSYGRALSATAQPQFAGSDGGEAVAPLLTAVRHQKAPYNAYCPRYIAADGSVSEERCVVGCVATALEEVISHYRRTVSLRDTLHGWTTPHYTIADVLPGTAVDTRLIRDDYDTPGTYTAEEADAVARLSYICGVAARMDWGLDASGARVRTLVEPLRRAFGFGFVHYADSYKYRPADWLAMLRAELRAGRPILYAGYAMRLNGHAFVLDGLDADGLYHVNWGVDGDYDGYFRLDILNAAEPAWDMTDTGAYEGFFCNQEALLLHPDAVDVQLPDTLCRTGHELSVDSIGFALSPEAGKYTPLNLYLHNRADYAVTTPLELFVNTPADTAIFGQAAFVALTGLTLRAGERRCLPVVALFEQPGRFALRLSPDDVNVIFTDSVTVAAAAGPQLHFDTPEIDFPDVETARIRQTVSNAGAGRAGGKVTYELFEGVPREDHNGTAHADYCYLPAGAAETDTVCFRGLTPGQAYTLYVRYPWEVQHTVRFTCPVVSGIGPAVRRPADGTPYYDLSGRRVCRPVPGGIYISGGVKVRVR